MGKVGIKMFNKDEKELGSHITKMVKGGYILTVDETDSFVGENPLIHEASRLDHALLYSIPRKETGATVFFHAISAAKRAEFRNYGMDLSVAQKVTLLDHDILENSGGNTKDKDLAFIGALVLKDCFEYVFGKGSERVMNMHILTNYADFIRSPIDYKLKKDAYGYKRLDSEIFKDELDNWNDKVCLLIKTDFDNIISREYQRFMKYLEDYRKELKQGKRKLPDDDIKYINTILERFLDPLSEKANNKNLWLTPEIILSEKKRISSLIESYILKPQLMIEPPFIYTTSETPWMASLKHTLNWDYISNIARFDIELLLGLNNIKGEELKGSSWLDRSFCKTQDLMDTASTIQHGAPLASQARKIIQGIDKFGDLAEKTDENSAQLRKGVENLEDVFAKRIRRRRKEIKKTVEDETDLEDQKVLLDKVEGEIKRRERKKSKMPKIFML